MKTVFLMFLAFALVLPNQLWAQAESSDVIAQTQNDATVVVGAGVGGAILGLSTLSFYDKPSKHIRNIWTGAAVGIIAGVVIVAVGHAQKTQDEFVYNPQKSPDFSTFARVEWHAQNVSNLSANHAHVGSDFWSLNF